MKSWLLRWYGTDHHGRNNASPRCQGRVCNESDCWPDTYWRQPLPQVTPPGSLARPARHWLARGLGRGEVRFRRSENAPRCIPAPLLPYSTKPPSPPKPPPHSEVRLDPSLRADARGRDGGVRQELAAGVVQWKPKTQVEATSILPSMNGKTARS
jgi:hypothetical protein